MRAALIAFLLLAACATEANFNAQMGALVGLSEADLVARMGKPKTIVVLTDGSRALAYVRSETVREGMPNQSAPARLTGGIYGGGSGVMAISAPSYADAQNAANTVTRTCTIVFRVVADHVESWKSQGDDCVAK